MIVQKPIKKKKKTLTYYKKRAWVEFSKWVRLHEADSMGMVKCVTCPKVGHWKTMQAGHFIPGRHNSILFDERGVHSQCYACNCGWLKGNPRKYNAYMIQTYGQKVIDELEQLDSVNKQFKVYELEAIYEAYRDLNNQMEEL